MIALPLRVVAAALVAVPLVTAPLVAPAGAPRAQAATTAAAGVDILAVGPAGVDRVSLIAAVPGQPPATAPTASVSAGDVLRPAQVTPLLSAGVTLGLLVDASADGAAALSAGGQSGAAGFLLQLPPGTPTAVVAARRPPEVVAAPEAGVAEDLRGLSALRAGGDRSLSESLSLAVDRLPARPGAPTVLVLYTDAPDAGGEAAADLGLRLRRANAVLAVVTSGPGTPYWAAAAEVTGGVAVPTGAALAIRAFDRVADALRSRYLVSFDPLPATATRAELRWPDGGAPVAFAIPADVSSAPDAAAGEPGAAASEPDAAAGGLPSALLLVVVLIVVLLVAATVLILRGRGAARREADDAGPDGTDDEEQGLSAAPGVRVFDILEPGAPREITDNPLFEPRSVRDARERAARRDDSPR